MTTGKRIAAGILNLAKPAGRTSRDVVNRVQKLVKPQKVGHAGTLDPMATGVLLVCIGHATRLVDSLHTFDKAYRATFRLGATSDTDDVWGHVETAGSPDHVTRESLEQALQQFVGTIQQVPPRVSAVHVEGRRAYQLARAQREFELTAREVTISAIDLIDFSTPDFTVDVTCSSGTYIRSLGRDVGELLGCGAVMTELTRTRIGPFCLSESVAADSVTPDTISDIALPPTTAVPHHPRQALDDGQVSAIRCGQALPVDTLRDFPALPASTEIVLLDPCGEMVGVARYEAPSRRLQPTLVFPAEKPSTK